MTQNNTVIGQVFKVLNSRKETDPTTFTDIKNVSQYEIDVFCTEFRLDYAHTIPYPFKDATINRAVEKWLKANR